MRHTGLYHKHQRMLIMRDNYLFQRICRECDKWEQEVKGKMVGYSTSMRLNLLYKLKETYNENI